MKMKSALIGFCIFLFPSAVFAQGCPYDNAFYLSGPVPTVVNQSVVAPDCWGGEYVTAQGMVAGSTYEISTCGDPTFDSQITIYTAGGGTLVGHDDDGCGPVGGSSKLNFTPTISGSYDILVDQFDCIDNAIDMDLTITLISTNGGGGPTLPALITIPVVVHVVFENASENISDQQIISQIEALYKDYRKVNADTLQNPGVFQALSADFQIEFCLADRDPSGAPTSGITRTQTTVNEFDHTNGVKHTATGGHDNWNPQHYLNLWCCDLGTQLLGYAQFPVDLATQGATDGVVINYRFFGTINVNAPFDQGRTATHEVGHWLNLRHVWGDAFCGDDFVGDTPTQETSNASCPAFPHITCSNGPNGDMYVNYMDYVDDACMHMFSEGQKTRALAALNSLRGQLFQSQGCSTVGIKEEYFAQSILIYPNPASDNIVIENISGNALLEMEMFNLVGNKVIHSTVISKQTIDVSSLSGGVYIVSISDGMNQAFKKIVINQSSNE